MEKVIEGFLGKSVKGKKSRLPARLDFIQSSTGLLLAIFMWAHMFFVSSILFSDQVFNKVAHMFEGSFLFDKPKPVIVTFVAIGVFIIFIAHAILAMRKFPINFRQYQQYRTHMKMMKHSDTSLWFVQALTGAIMFFFASFHLGYMLFFPHTINAVDSSSRMYTDFMWPFYLVLLFCVELHGSIGLYRLCVKWGWFEGKNAKSSRKNLKNVKWILSFFFIILGLVTMLAFLKLGYEYKAKGISTDIYSKNIYIQKYNHNIKILDYDNYIRNNQQSL